MRDFPFFTTEYGVSSLTLKEIPYRKTAYIKILQVQPGFFTEHLDRCADFCRAAGAERILASGEEGLERYPLHAAVLEMRGTALVDPEQVACLFPVTRELAGRWREIYNGLMASVDNAGTLEARDEKRILGSGGAYFVHRNGELMGIGWLEDETILAMGAVRGGGGQIVLNTLLSLVEDRTVRLEVASTNHRAIRLYERMGFCRSREVSRWYRVEGPAAASDDEEREV